MPVEIVLDEKHTLTSDPNQWILSKRVGKRIIPRYYYSSLESLLKDYVDLCLRTSNSKSIGELKGNLNFLISQLNRTLSPLKIKISKGDLNE